MANSEKSLVPDWINSKLFEQVLKDTVDGYKETKDFRAKRAEIPGENISTIMLQIEIVVVLQNGTQQPQSYMVKVAHDNEMMKEILANDNMFTVEMYMFSDMLPELEAMFRDAGVQVKFGARCYKLPTDKDYVALEDLSKRGFRNAKRLEGLDMEHMKCVLKKLAMFHAASATRVQTRGKYPEIYSRGAYSDTIYPIIKQVYSSSQKPLMQCLKTFKGSELYMPKVEKLHPDIVDVLFGCWSKDEDEFKVLNHGDLWTNNIMFQYDEATNAIKETYLVDLQGPCYQTPAMDLVYFIISSAQYEIKVKEFDYFIKYYHDNLIENLTLLKYPKKLPTLKEIHMSLLKHGFFGYTSTIIVMGAALLDPIDPKERANFEHFTAETDAGDRFRLNMYSSPRYRKHAELLFPWLLNRGALEYPDIPIKRDSN